jgi:hypothetical protein
MQPQEDPFLSKILRPVQSPQEDPFLAKVLRPTGAPTVEDTDPPKKREPLAPTLTGDPRMAPWTRAAEAKAPARTFDARSDNYDLERARVAGLTRDAEGHMGSVAPTTAEERQQFGLPEESYVMLKGRTHPTWQLGVQGEEERGFKVVQLNGRDYSVPKDWTPSLQVNPRLQVEEGLPRTSLNRGERALRMAQEGTEAIARGGALLFPASTRLEEASVYNRAARQAERYEIRLQEYLAMGLGEDAEVVKLLQARQQEQIDLMQSPERRQRALEAQQILDFGSEDREEQHKRHGLLGRLGLTVAESFPATAATLGAAITAPAALPAALGLMATSAGGQTVAEAAPKVGERQAADMGVRSTVYELLPEYLAARVFMQPASSLTSRLLKYMAVEGGGEGVTELLQSLDAKANTDPQMTWKDVLSNAAFGAAAGLLGGATIGAGATAIQHIGRGDAFDVSARSQASDRETLLRGLGEAMETTLYEQGYVPPKAGIPAEKLQVGWKLFDTDSLLSEENIKGLNLFNGPQWITAQPPIDIGSTREAQTYALGQRIVQDGPEAALAWSHENLEYLAAQGIKPEVAVVQLFQRGEITKEEAAVAVKTLREGYNSLLEEKLQIRQEIREINEQLRTLDAEVAQALQPKKGRPEVIAYADNLLGHGNRIDQNGGIRKENFDYWNEVLGDPLLRLMFIDASTVSNVASTVVSTKDGEYAFGVEKVGQLAVATVHTPDGSRIEGNAGFTSRAIKDAHNELAKQLGIPRPHKSLNPPSKKFSEARHALAAWALFLKAAETGTYTPQEFQLVLGEAVVAQSDLMPAGSIFPYGIPQKDIVDTRPLAGGGAVGFTQEVSSEKREAITALLEKWSAKFAPGHVFSVGGAKYTSERAAGTAYPSKEVSSIGLKDANKKGPLTPREISLLAHEFGHAVLYRLFRNSSLRNQQRLAKAWLATVGQAWARARTMEDYFNLTDATTSNAWAHSGSDFRTEVLKNLIKSTAGGTESYYLQYHANFDEFLAHSMDRMIFSEADEMIVEPLSPIKKEYERMSQYLLTETGYGDKTLKLFMQRNLLRASIRERLNNAFYSLKVKALPAELMASEAELVRAGLVQEGAVAAAITVAMLRPTGAPQLRATAATTGLSDGVMAQLYTPVNSQSSPTAVWSKTLGLSPQMQQGVDKLGLFRRLTFGLLEIARANPHIKELSNPTAPLESQGYADLAGALHNERMQWYAKTAGRANQWRSLSGQDKKILDRLLIDETLANKVFDLKDPAVRAKYPLSAEGEAHYDSVRADFVGFLDEMRQTTLASAQRKLANNPLGLALRQKEINDAFNKLTKGGYFPLMRFGTYVTTVRDSVSGKTLARYHYDSALARKLELGTVRRKFPGARVQTTAVSDPTLRGITALPASIIDAIKTELNLNASQLKALDDYLAHQKGAEGYAARLLERKGVAGFSNDTMRGYVQYFQQGANYLARLKYDELMRDSLQRLRASASDLDDGTKRIEIFNWAQRHYEYTSNPSNDFAKVRSAVALWFLAAVPASAFVNVTQLPLFTYPYLASRFGDAKAIQHMTSSTRDIPRMIRAGRPMTKEQELAFEKHINGLPLTPAEQKLIERYTALKFHEYEAIRWALDTGILDESFATEVAAMSEGNWLNKWEATNEAGYRARQFVSGTMFLFQAAEKLNRRITYLAAYRSFRETYGGTVDMEARIFAKRAVEETQFEYSKFNRPEGMQGTVGVYTVFLAYYLRAMHFAFGGSEQGIGARVNQAWRYWAMMLALVGPFGLPLAGELKALIEWLWSKANPNKRLNIEYEMNKALKELGGVAEDYPEAFTNGALSLLPWDLSGSLSMGTGVPGFIDLLDPASRDNAAHTMRVAEDAAGPFGQIVSNFLSATSQGKQGDWKFYEAFMPRAMASISAAGRWYSYGEEVDRRGSSIVQFGPEHKADLVGKALGFSPRSVKYGRRDEEGDLMPGNFGRKELGMMRSIVEFYAIRRERLAADFVDAVQQNDPKKQEERLEAIRAFNAEAPASMAITSKQLRTSAKNRLKAEALGELGLQRERSKSALSLEIQERRF